MIEGARKNRALNWDNHADDFIYVKRNCMMKSPM